MSRQQWLSIIGVWVMVFLKLGFPSSWNEPFAVCTGLLIVFISFKMGPRKQAKNSGQSQQSAYVDNGEKA